MKLVDIEDLLSRLGIEIRKRSSGGRELWACCPLPGHEERTPSWQIRTDPEDPERHGKWRCLGACHEGGGPTGLVMRVLGFERASEARNWIRSGAALEVTSPFARAIAEQTSPLALEAPRTPPSTFKPPRGIRFAPFEEWPSVPRQYAISRGLDAEQVDRWGIGFAIDGKLSGRLVLPWRNGRGVLGGYTGRSFLPGEKKKHLEPSQEEGAARGWVYGEELWPGSRRNPGLRRSVAVVEGAFDGFAIERLLKIPFAAARGSHLDPGHVLRIGSFPDVLVFGDPDTAGARFLDAIVAALSRTNVVIPVRMPKGFDAARLEREHPLRLVEAYEAATARSS